MCDPAHIPAVLQLQERRERTLNGAVGCQPFKLQLPRVRTLPHRPLLIYTLLFLSRACPSSIIHAPQVLFCVIGH